MFSSSKLDSDLKLTQFGKYILITNSNFLQNRTFSHRLSETVPWQEKALSAAALLRRGDDRQMMTLMFMTLMMVVTWKILTGMINTDIRRAIYRSSSWAMGIAHCHYYLIVQWVQ